MTDDALATAIQGLQDGGIIVARTDTLYGVLALAHNRQAVEKVYAAKHRDTNKQCIVLLASPEDAPAHNTVIAQVSEKSTMPITVVVPASSEPQWLLRGGDSLAYRVVRSPFLAQVIRQVGPVIAPSANPEGLPPASTIAEAKQYFGDSVNAYIDGGTVPSDVQASTIVKVSADGPTNTLR